MKKPFDLDAAYQPSKFTFRNPHTVKEITARYPKGFQASAVMPLLDLAQRQLAEDGAKLTPPVGGWIPRAAMDEIASLLDMPQVKVYEVASYYTMYHLAPIGKYLLQVCTTTPCWLCSSDAIMQAIKDHLGLSNNYDTTEDGYFTLLEVECLGACANAPMVQINDHYYEDLNYERMIQILTTFQQDTIPPSGPQNGRRGSMAITGPTSLQEKAAKTGAINS